MEKKYDPYRIDEVRGIGLVEIIVAVAIWTILMSTGVALLAGSFRSNRLADELRIGTDYLQEGIEAALSIKKQGWTSPFLATNCTGGCGMATVSGTWGFSGSNNVEGKYTRQIFVTPVNRDCSGNIVTSGGDADPNTYKVESRVSWNRIAPNITDTISKVEYFTNYKGRRGGMLVYGDGGTTTDAIGYKIFNGVTSTWETASAAADIDGGTTNRALRLVRLYGSTCKEKIMISRHSNGAQQYIYSQVFNGTSWGNVQLLASWAGPTFMEVHNFDGTYLNDGSFMAVYADNSTTPKYRTWNGTVWSAEGSLTTLGAGQIPNYIVSSARPGTNEVMVAILTRVSDTMTQYWNGSWSAITTHSTLSPANQKKMVDFAWSPNNTLIGGLIFADAVNDKTLNIAIWTADGAGSGSWSSVANSSAQTDNLGGLALSGRAGANEFIACNKDANNPTSRIVCYKSDFTPTWTNPTNQILSTSAPNGNQRNYHAIFESLYGDNALAVFSEDTTTPKLKKYTSGTTTWDASATNLPTLAGVATTVRLSPVPFSDDILILLGDANEDLYTIFWDGDNNAAYTTPSSLALTSQATNGSVDTEDWYDFAWDKP